MEERSGGGAGVFGVELFEEAGFHADQLGFVTLAEMLPGEDLIFVSLAVGKEGRVQVVLLEGVEINIVIETLAPGVEASAVAVGGFEDRAQSAVAPGEDAFE